MREVRKTFEALAYLVKGVDPDGIDLHFTNSPRSARVRTRGQALYHLDRLTSQGQSDTPQALETILDQGSGSEEHSLPPRHRETRDASIYIFTDGVWNENFSIRVSELIRNPVTRLAPGGSFNIQFIRFGDDDVGFSRLRELDEELQTFGHA